MKSKIIKYIKSSILFFGISLLLSGCQKDDNFINENTIPEAQEQKLSVEHINRDRIKKNIKLSSKLELLTSKLYENTNSISNKESGKYVKDYDFIIDTESATYIQDGDYNSYTFPIIQSKAQNIKNVLFSLNDENEYDSYLVEYDYTYDQLDSLDSYQLSKRTKMTPISLDFRSLTSRVQAYYFCSYTYELVDTGDLVGAGNENFEWILLASDCTTIWGTVDYGDEYYTSTVINNPATGDPSYSGSGNLFTSPTLSNMYDEDDIIMFGMLKSSLGLNIAEYDWLINHYSSAKAIFDFLGQNLVSQEAQDFANFAIDALMDGGEVDFPNKVILEKSFTDNVQLKCVYDKLTQDNNSLFRNTVGAFIDDPKFNLTFRIGECSNTNDQCTDDNDPYNIVITFEDVNTNPIEMAQAILHEAIHAEIARFVEQYQSGIDVNNRPYLFQLYAYYKGWADSVDPNFNWDNAADHQFMITNYVDKIASALRELDNYRFPLDNYKSYAWDGLRGKYNYRGTLTTSQENYYTSLRVQTNQGIQICN